MRSAPPVSLSVGAPPVWRLVHALPCAAAAAALCAWLLARAEWPLWPALAMSGLGGLLGWRWPGTGRHELRWDGAGWHLDGEPAALSLQIDAGSWMAVQLRTGGMARPRSRWLAVSRADAGAAWPAWRTAVYCRRPDTPPAARPR